MPAGGPVCGLVAGENATLQERLFAFAPQRALEPFAGRGGESLRGGLVQLLRMLARRPPQETDLLSVAAAPLAEQKMEAQPEPLRQREVPVQSVGLEPGDLTTRGHKRAEPCLQGRRQTLQGFHLDKRVVSPRIAKKRVRFRAGPPDKQLYRRSVVAGMENLTIYNLRR